MTSETQVARLLSLRFWRAYAVTLRPYLMFLSFAAGLTGLALSESGPLWPLYALVFFFSYGLGQAITDTTQTDTDALSSPYRPLVRGDVSQHQVLITSLVGLTLCGFVIFYANPWAVLPAIIAAGGLLTYTWFKRHWWGGPAWNGWIVATLPLIGVLCGGSTLTTALARTDVILVMISVFATYVPFVILGYFKDVSADAATGYQTIVVRFGSRVAILVSVLHTLIGLVASAALVIKATTELGASAALFLWCLGWVLIFIAHFRLWMNPAEATAYRGIELSASAFVAIHLGEAAVFQPGFLGLSVIVYATSVWMLRRRPTKEQI